MNCLQTTHKFINELFSAPIKMFASFCKIEMFSFYVSNKLKTDLEATTKDAKTQKRGCFFIKEFLHKNKLLTHKFTAAERLK